MLSSDVQRVCVEVDLWDDSIVEQEEGFFCVLSHSDSSYFSNSNLERPLATVILEDNDGMYYSIYRRKMYLLDLSSVVTVGFEQEEYTCSGSGSETCDVCISFLTSTLLDRTTFLYLSVITISETTESE